MGHVANLLHLPARWTHSSHIDTPAGGTPANGVFDVVTLSAPFEAHHRYHVAISVSSFCHLGIGAKWTLRHGDQPADIIAQAHGKAHRGADANILLEVPLNLSGSFIAAATGSQDVILSMQPDAIWHDWALATAFADLQIIDMGVAPA